MHRVRPSLSAGPRHVWGRVPSGRTPAASAAFVRRQKEIAADVDLLMAVECTFSPPDDRLNPAFQRHKEID
jgi:hypothetical protein